MTDNEMAQLVWERSDSEDWPALLHSIISIPDGWGKLNGEWVQVDDEIETLYSTIHQLQARLTRWAG